MQQNANNLKMPPNESSRRNLAAMLCLILFSTLATMSKTLLLARPTTGADGAEHYFDHPYVMAVINSAGRSLCVVAFVIKKCLGKKEENPSLPFNPLVLLPSTIFGLVGVTLGNIGMVYTRDPATRKMVNIFKIVWCAVLSIPIFKMWPAWHQWIGIFLVSAGVFVKVSINIPGLFPDYSKPDYCQQYRNITDQVGEDELEKDKAWIKTLLISWLHSPLASASCTRRST